MYVKIHSKCFNYYNICQNRNHANKLRKTHLRTRLDV